MIEISKSKSTLTKTRTKTRTINTTESNATKTRSYKRQFETQRLRFKDKNRFYSMSDYPSKVKSKYTKQPCCLARRCVDKIEFIRWKLNLLLLLRPFSWLSAPVFKKRVPIFFIRLTLCEIALAVLFLYPIAYWQWFIYDGKQTGIMAQYWYTATWILAMRNNIMFQIVFGLSFERLIILHRITAILATILAIRHAWYNWIARPLPRYPLFEGFAVYGTFALICNFLIILTALPFIRRRFFEFFYRCHWVLFTAMAVFSILHIWQVQGNVQVTLLVIYGVIAIVIDILFRIYSMYFEVVKIKDMKLLNGNVIRIEFNKKCGFKYEAGQYVFICIPSIGFTESHPFTLSSSPFRDDSIVIHVRILGDWTGRLQELVAIYEDNGYDWSELICFMEGPYGQLQVPLHNYSSIVMISGGIGITPLQSIFNELVHNIRLNKENTHNVKKIHFVWAVRDPSMITEFEKKHWAGIQYDCKYHNEDDRRVSISLPKYFSPNLFIIKDEKDITNQIEIVTHFYMTRIANDETKERYKNEFPFIKFGRPDIDNILWQAANNYGYLSSVPCVGCVTKSSGVVALSCGPNEMLDDVKRYCAKYGIACHTEIFEF